MAKSKAALAPGACSALEFHREYLVEWADDPTPECPWCKAKMRLRKDGRFPNHRKELRPSQAICAGSSAQPNMQLSDNVQK